MSKKLVSVVIVTKDRPKEVGKAMASIYRQTYKPIEVVLVDNGSINRVSDLIKDKYRKTKIISNLTYRGAAGGRNLGFLNTKGEFIFFMDDDAFADKDAISQLIKVAQQDPKIGIVGPKIYYANKKNVIQGIGHNINLLTGRVIGIGVGKQDFGQYEKIIDIPMIGCAWMVKRGVFNKIGKYDEDFFIPYEDSDFSIRARKADFRICYVPKAHIWHSSHYNLDIPQSIQWLGIINAERAYRISRNKIIFMKKHAHFLNLLIFLLIFSPIYVMVHSAIILFSRRLDILRYYWKGLLSGFKYVLVK